ncbi:TRI39 ligase, partial [Polyodon spathula]|nr:TRI39 ligase [Polyodon spathula]
MFLKHPKRSRFSLFEVLEEMDNSENVSENDQLSGLESADSVSVKQHLKMIWRLFRISGSLTLDLEIAHPRLTLPVDPQKLGVYLDYEEEQFFFYNVETNSHIYTFTDMEFNPNEKLYPFFWSLEYKDLELASPGKMNDRSFLLLVWEGILAASGTGSLYYLFARGCYAC